MRACCGEPFDFLTVKERMPFVALLGQPNVGKSALMNALTGAGAVVSNYAGTTVDVTVGDMEHRGYRIRVVDTPGIYSLTADTLDQKVARDVLLSRPNLIVNVVDANNLARSLELTLEILEFGIPMVVALNQMDMVREKGVEVSLGALREALGVPVVPLVASRNLGIQELKEEIIESLLNSPRNQLAVRDTHILSCDRQDIGEHRVEDCEACNLSEELEKRLNRAEKAREIAQGALMPKVMATATRSDTRDTEPNARQLRSGLVLRLGNRAQLESLLDSSPLGLILEGVVVFAAIRLVGLVMTSVEGITDQAGTFLTEWLNRLLARAGVVGPVRTLILALPDGILMPFSVVLPAMFAIYLVMAVLEDSGLLPRISASADRLMSFVGLPGQGVIPLALGFGCKVPAVLATRSLPAGKYRVLSAALIAMTVPCAATVGIITGVGQATGAHLSVVYSTMLTTFLIAGFVGKRLLKVQQGAFAVDIPPLRVPTLRNLEAKLKMHLSGFFRHTLPVLFTTGVAVTVLVQLGAFEWLSRFDPWTRNLFGIPGQALVGVAVSVFQRYMGPMVLAGLGLSSREATIAVSMVAVSAPCLPVSVVLSREMGFRTLAVIYGLAVAVSASVGLVLNFILP